MTWLFAHDGSTKETADRVAVEFEGVTIDELNDLFETAWDGDTFSEADLVDPAVIQETKRFASARRLLEGTGGEPSRWSQLQNASRQLEAEHPNHPITNDVQAMLASSQPPDVEEVERLIEAAESPFEVDERLAELAEELQAQYPDHETTTAVVSAVESDTPPSDQRVGELIADAEQLLDGVDEQLRRIQETLDDLDDDSTVLVERLE